MKKILSLGAAAAVLSLTAVAASAAITPTFDATPVAGETVTVTITANGMTQTGTQFTVNASDNLTLTDYTPISSGYAVFNKDNGKFAWAGSEVPADGTTLITLTYTVDAAADEEVSVTLVPDEGFTDISADAATDVVVAGADSDVTDETADAGETVESEEVDTAETAETTETADEPGVTVEPDTADATAEGGDENGSDKGNPETGVALAVVPAVLAGAAIVVAKKRK